MHPTLNDFIGLLDGAAPRLTLGSGPEPLSLYFILDQQVMPDLQTQLFATGEPVNPVPLFLGTEFEHLQEIGPLWFAAPLGSALQQLGEQLSREHAAGIAVTASDETTALAHARWLLLANDGSGGQSLVTYCHPDQWAAMAMTAPEGLYGPWHQVHSPSPRHIGAKPGHWLTWPQSDATGLHTPLTRYSFTPSTPSAYRTLRWLYWIDGYYPAFNEPTTDQLPQILDNLELLVDYGLTEGRWLVKLADLSSLGPLSEREAVMTILRSQAEPFIKVEQLQALAP